MSYFHMPLPARPGQAPTTTAELKAMVLGEIAREGHACSLNHIEVGYITDFRSLFENSDFNGDISAWDVGRGDDFSRMFANSAFKGDISQWNTSNATSMKRMFTCSAFAGDVSRWDVSQVSNAEGMFVGSPFNGDLSQWTFAPDVESWGPLNLLAFVGHTQYYVRDKLRLPMLPVECKDLFCSDKVMHAWLAARVAQHDIGRYHWDALLRNPYAPWAPQEMCEFARTYLSVAPEMPASCVAHSAQLMHLWETRLQHQTEGTLALPPLEEYRP